MTTKNAVLWGGQEDVRASEILKNTVTDMNVSFCKYIYNIHIKYRVLCNLVTGKIIRGLFDRTFICISLSFSLSLTSFCLSPLYSAFITRSLLLRHVNVAGFRLQHFFTKPD